MPTCSRVTSTIHSAKIRRRWSANWVMWTYSSCAKLHQKYNVLIVFFVGIKGLCTALADNSWQSLSRTTWSRKALPMVLETANPKYRENTTWLGMRGRDAVRKSTPKVNILQVSTIDFSEIQFIVNHNSPWDGQNQSAKSGMNLRKKTTHTNSLHRKREDTKDNGNLFWTKQAKMGLWSFDLITEPLSWWKIAYTTNQENQLKSPSIQVNKDAYEKDKKFSLKITCPALELINIQDGNIGFQLQVPRGGTHPNGVGSELTKFFLARISFLLQLVSFTAEERSTVTDGWVWTEHPHTAYFLAQLDTFHPRSHAPHGSRCCTTCLHGRALIHMSPRVWSCVVSPCFDLVLSFECLYL